MELKLETKSQKPGGIAAGGLVMTTPNLDEDYWSYRVKLSDTQAILGFPKITTIGIGFAQEEDWNTNLPYTCGTEEIYDHIAHNKGDDSITREDCLQAIRLVQEAAKRASAMTRLAVIARSPLGRPSGAEVARYLPANYKVAWVTPETITIEGHDRAGWTLDDYVIPRLGSGLIFAREIERDTK